MKNRFIDGIGAAILRPRLVFAKLEYWFNRHETHVVGRSLTENSTPITGEFPAVGSRVSSTAHWAMLSVSLRGRLSIGGKNLMDANTYINREISWLELNRRAFSVVRATFRLVAQQIHLFSITTQRSVSCCNTKCPCYVFIDGSLFNSIIRWLLSASKF